MPREIKKKILDEAPRPSAPPPGSKGLTEGSRGETDSLAGATTGASKTPLAGSGSPPMPQGGKKLDSGFEFSLDDFDPPEGEEAPAAPAQPLPEQTDEHPETAQESKQSGQAKVRRPFPTKLATIAVVCCLVVVVGLLSFRHWRGAADAAKQTIITKIKRPIVVPSYEEKLNFLVFASSTAGRNLLIMDLELKFSDDDRHKRFQEDIVLIRDLIFNFLATQRPTRNSESDWGKIIGSDLNGYIKSALPESRADAVRLSRMTRL